MNDQTHRFRWALKSMAVSAAAMLMSGAATADWKSGYGQGSLEYFSDKQDLRLYIACPTSETGTDQTSSITLSRISTGHQIQKFTLMVNGHSFEGPLKSDSRVDSANFLALMDDLRKGDAVVQYALGKVVFPKTNAAKVIPAAGRRFPCNTGF